MNIRNPLTFSYVGLYVNASAIKSVEYSHRNVGKSRLRFTYACAASNPLSLSLSLDYVCQV